MNSIAKYVAALVVGLGLMGLVGCEDPGDDHHDHGEDQGPAAPPPSATQPTNQ
jgi:hypothetical protein